MRRLGSVVLGAGGAGPLHRVRTGLADSAEGSNRTMTGYAVRWLISLLSVLLIVATVGLFPIYLMPGDPASVMLGLGATAEEVDNLQRIMGLDRPLR